MITSMTGFSQITETIELASKEQITVSVEIKSLNARFFDAFCKLPSSLSSFELKIASKLKASLYRGKVFFSIKISEELGVLEVPTISTSVAQQYLASIQELQKKLSLPGTLTINDVVQLPQLFAFEKKSLQEVDHAKIHALVDQAIKLLIVERVREGKALHEDLVLRLKHCEEKIEEIRKRFELLIDDQKKVISEVSVLVQSGEEAEKPRLDELYIHLNKMDIHEEVSRFVTHVEALFVLFKSDNKVEKGRKVDFLLQELFREINTITAKCSDSSMTSLAVDVKVEIEKAREQVQNIV
ncbi:YicC family protein [Candidatus Dependentiae bacterium]|nr:MAG: YicC family protein [Candidatus Dependentiae bacterium]